MSDLGILATLFFQVNLFIWMVVSIK